MKILLLINLLIFSWIPPKACLLIDLCVSSFPDTIATLAGRVEKHLEDLYFKIEEEKTKLESIQVELSRMEYDKKRYKKTKISSVKLNESLNLNYQKQNAYRHILTMVYQLRIQNEFNANSQLKEIEKALKKLDKNKLPALSNLNSIPSTPNLRNNTLVYDKEISSLCNLTRSPDNKILANVYENFFEFTDQKLSTHYKETDFLQCQVRFIKTKNKYFLEFKFLLNSPKASSIYGTIDPSNPTKIDFLNGDFIYLETHALATGTIDQETGGTVYNIQYKLNNEDISNLRKKDIDSLTIIWTSGADQFEICKIDLLRNMFECIQKRKLQN